MSDQDMKKLWKDQPAPGMVLSPDDLRKQARSFQRRVGLRNLLEYLAALLVIAGFTNYLWAFPFLLMRVGSVLVILGIFVVMHQLRHRASSRPLPGTDIGMPCFEFHRAQLVRQRDALRSVWLWYVGPVVPGVVVFRWGVETELGPWAPFARGLLANLVIAAVLLGVIGLNLSKARALQREIDRLDRVASDPD